jgi:hypothetical protein
MYSRLTSLLPFSLASRLLTSENYVDQINRRLDNLRYLACVRPIYQYLPEIHLMGVSSRLFAAAF